MHRKITLFACGLMALLVLVCVPSRASAQECPRMNPAGPDISSGTQSLKGKLIYHDGIRQWFELRLDKPKCGQGSLQLVQLNNKSKSLEILRGCRVESTGKLGDAGTGYFSLAVYQDVRRVRPIGVCSKQRPLPNYSKYKPDRHVNAYTVHMHVDYGPGDHPVTFQVRTEAGELQPWQAYASYWMTGGYVLYGQCGEGFDVDEVFGTPAARPLHFDDPRTPADKAEFDPESAAAAGKWHLDLGYTCIRDRTAKHVGKR